MDHTHGLAQLPKSSRRRSCGRFFYPLVSALTVVVILSAWSLVSGFKLVNPAFLPSPTDVWAAFVELCQDGYKGETLIKHILVSLQRLFKALGAALILAIPLGLAAGSSRLVRAIIDPIIEFYRPLPPLAYYTLLILFLGIGDESKVTLLFLSAFAPLLIGIIFSVQKIPQDRLRVARSLGAGGWKLLFNVVLPSCLPDILTGFRTSVGLAYATLVAAEMVAAISGLGWLVLDASKFLRNDIVFTGVIILGSIALIMDLILRRVITIVSPWLDQES
ncbi:MAG: ABC transporter permease subunit [Deltaproteobacteria bacterium]|jgi:taurine transport system permease protein|nr:ABC transporter permease subunit [Deltaproteobacteria bacterium]